MSKRAVVGTIMSLYSHSLQIQTIQSNTINFRSAPTGIRRFSAENVTLACLHLFSGYGFISAFGWSCEPPCSQCAGQINKTKSQPGCRLSVEWDRSGRTKHYTRTCKWESCNFIQMSLMKFTINLLIRRVGRLELTQVTGSTRLNCFVCSITCTPSSHYSGKHDHFHIPLLQSSPATRKKQPQNLSKDRSYTERLPVKCCGLVFTRMTSLLGWEESNMGMSGGRLFLVLCLFLPTISADTSIGMLRNLSLILSCASTNSHTCPEHK